MKAGEKGCVAGLEQDTTVAALTSWNPQPRLGYRLRELWLVRRRALSFLVVVFCICLVGFYVVDRGAEEPRVVVVEMRSNVSSVAQLFYDIGRGINETDSVSLPVAATETYSSLRFELPRARIRALRFDPLNGPGVLSIRRVYVADPSGSMIREFAHSNLIALNQIVARADTGFEIELEVLPPANDPHLHIDMPGLPRPWLSNWKGPAQIFRLVAASLLITALVAAVYLATRSGGGASPGC
jgi:hypothetical protein